jgi:hypothetical protein
VHEVPCWVTVTVVPATVSCAVRDDVLVLAVTVKETVEVPVPLETAGTSQDLLSVTCQVQFEVVVTVTLPELAAAGSVMATGVTVNVQADVPCCVTLTVVPATVSCADRADVEVFAVTENETVAFPFPLETAGVSHVALSDTCHVQPAFVVTVTLLELASAPTVSVVGETANVHVMPCCVTVTAVPATVSCAFREAVPEFAVTEKETVAGPVPLATAGVNHVALSVTCHVQPSSVSMVTAPVPAAAVSVSVSGVTTNVQTGGLSCVTLIVVPATVN